MQFEAVIGLEIHVQISTKTKMFCRCDNDSFGKAPNINTCPICMGFPGQLPIINKIAIEKGVRAALALNCEVPEKCKFDRKNYFYPDSPKGFQISQYDEPLSLGGYVEIDTGPDSRLRVGITRLHLEDDAGKLTHIKGGSLVDFNRAGTPLMEIVSEPDLRSASDASAYAREVQKIVRYVGSSEADMEKGMMRFDASVSIREMGDSKLYPRAEIKNLNSFKALESAIEFEISRQIALWEEGKPLSNPITVGWDAEKAVTFFMRDKEESDDYRYFPEPDIPPIHLDPKTVEAYRSDLPEMPAVKKKRYMVNFGLNEDDSRILSEDPVLAAYFEKVVDLSGDAKRAVSFINTILMARLKEDLIDISNQSVTPEMMAELIDMVSVGKISNNAAKTEVFDEMYKTGISPEIIVQERGLTQVSDFGAIEEACMKVLDANPESVADIKNGKDKAIGFLVGQVMKETKGQANPQIVNDVIKKLIS